MACLSNAMGRILFMFSNSRKGISFPRDYGRVVRADSCPICLGYVAVDNLSGATPRVPYGRRRVTSCFRFRSLEASPAAGV
jgi:hypothetical protein